MLTLLTTILLPLAGASVSITAVPTATTTTPALLARCDGNGDCTYGGTATTLTAPTVTTTILSVTSVPCYITTYVTDSTTTTLTVYSTEVPTSTITLQGTVTVIKYQPTPIIKSSEYTSVFEITQTGTTYWTENEGVAYDSTVTGGTATIGGSIGGNGHIQEAKSTGSAWTHAAANSQTVGSGNTGDGWAAAAAAAAAAADSTATLGVAGTTGTGTGTGAAAGANGVTVNWGGAAGQCEEAPTSLVIGLAMSVVAILEAGRWL